LNVKDSQGRALFTNKTEKIAKEQTKKVQWVQDPTNNMEMYRKIPAGKRSTHQLPKWLSNRPESGLEKFHEFLAHLANTGSGFELADALTLGGTADHNVKARWREQVNENKLLGKEINGTVEYSEEPEFFDHSYLHHLNHLAICRGLDPVFEHVVPPGEDHGIAFLSKYFKEQQKRNSTVSQDPTTKLCNCRYCQEYVPSKPTAAETRLPNEEQQANDAVFEMEQEKEHHWSTQQIIQPRSVNLAAAAPIPALVAPPFYSAPFGIIPYNCCFNWPPFYCPKKQDYLFRKHHGQGRRGRPPNCSLNCQGQGQC
jgi:hypothetical protein